MIALRPIPGIGEVEPGANLAELLVAALAANAIGVTPGDILVITSKIVSKAENRFVELGSVRPDADAQRLAKVTGKDPRFVATVLAESVGVVRAAPNVLITRHRLGHVMANAGIDRSNLGPGRADQVLLLPRAPDRSARAIRESIGTLLGLDLGILISDSFGRPWRLGVTGVALGSAGLPSLADQRGRPDRDGRPLEGTLVGVGDLLASAAMLVTGEGAQGIPAVLVQGLGLNLPERSAAELIRPLEEDLFR